MSKLSSCILFASLLGPTAALSQDAVTAPVPAPTPAPAPAAVAPQATPPALPVKLGGTIDAYYGINLDRGQESANELRAYDAATGFQLGLAEVSASMEAQPAGFRLDLAFGPGPVTPGTDFVNQYVLQAYVSMKLGPTLVDFGRFVTPAGFERIEAKDNWLYSRGLLFKYAIPRTHQGVRVALPLGDGVAIAGYLSNGSDLQSNDLDQPLTPHKTAIISATYAKETTRAAVNLFYTKPAGLDDTGFLADAYVVQGFGDAALSVSGDYGKIGSSEWYGIGGQGSYTIPGDKLRIAARFEWMDDKDGIRGGIPAKAWDVTAGVAYPVGANVELRGELRYDHASEPVVYPGADSGTTATIAAVAWF